MKATVIKTLRGFSGGRFVVDHLYGTLWHSLANALFTLEKRGLTNLQSAPRLFLMMRRTSNFPLMHKVKWG